MPIKYYRKEIPTTPVYIDGVPFKFDITKTEDPALITALDRCISDQIGGVISMAADDYESEAKKKATGQPSSYGSSPRGQRSELSAALVRAAGAEAESNAQELARVQAEPQGIPGVSPVTGRPEPQPLLVPSPKTMESVMTSVPKTAKVVRK